MFMNIFLCSPKFLSHTWKWILGCWVTVLQLNLTKSCEVDNLLFPSERWRDWGKLVYWFVSISARLVTFCSWLHSVSWLLFYPIRRWRDKCCIWFHDVGKVDKDGAGSENNRGIKYLDEKYSLACTTLLALSSLVKILESCCYSGSLL